MSGYVCYNYNNRNGPGKHTLANGMGRGLKQNLVNIAYSVWQLGFFSSSFPNKKPSAKINWASGFETGTQEHRSPGTQGYRNTGTHRTGLGMQQHVREKYVCIGEGATARRVGRRGIAAELHEPLESIEKPGKSHGAEAV